MGHYEQSETFLEGRSMNKPSDYTAIRKKINQQMGSVFSKVHLKVATSKFVMY